MNGKYDEVLEQYTFEVNSMTRVRGGMLLDTDEGYKIIKETKTSAGRLVWEHKVKEHLIKQGFEDIDSFCINNDGNISSKGPSGIRYVVRNWFVGEECNIRDAKEVRGAAKKLALLHSCLKNVEPYEYSMCSGASDIDKTFERHNMELGHIRNYLRQRKDKNNYELALLAAFPDYYNIALKVLEYLKMSSLKQLSENACEGHNVVHGSYTYHNVIFCDDVIAVTAFDKCTYGLQLMDLYYFMRKVMEKNEWDVEFGDAVLSGYESVKKLPDEEKNVLALLMLYPEKFWKLASCYMNSKKTWISEKNMEKLNALCIQRENREKFIKEQLLKEKEKFGIL